MYCHESHAFSCPPISERRHRLSAMSGDAHHFDDNIDEVENGVETEYSDFCDDDTICAAPASCFESYPSSASTLGKRKSLDEDDLELFSGPSATYKRRILPDDGAEPYIIVRFIRAFRAPLRLAAGTQLQCPTSDGQPWTSLGRSMGDRTSRLARPLHLA